MANSAKRDPNGTWHIQFRYKDWTGTIKKTSRKGFKTKKELPVRFKTDSSAKGE